MASESSINPSELIGPLINSRNREPSLFLPFLLDFIGTGSGYFRRENNHDPRDETSNQTAPRDRIIFVNPYTQNMIVMEDTSSFDSLLRELSNKNGQPPATKASIEAMSDVVIEKNDLECVICLDEWKIGDKVKEMPCKHRFCGKCIEKWLMVHGSCPVCRFKMPVDNKNDLGNKNGGGDLETDGTRRRIGREIWVSFSFEHRRGGVNDDSSNSSDHDLDE